MIFPSEAHKCQIKHLILISLLILSFASPVFCDDGKIKLINSVRIPADTVALKQQNIAEIRQEATGSSEKTEKAKNSKLMPETKFISVPDLFFRVIKALGGVLAVVLLLAVTTFLIKKMLAKKLKVNVVADKVVLKQIDEPVNISQATVSFVRHKYM